MVCVAVVAWCCARPSVAGFVILHKRFLSSLIDVGRSMFIDLMLDLVSHMCVFMCVTP